MRGKTSPGPWKCVPAIGHKTHKTICDAKLRPIGATIGGGHAEPCSTDELAANGLMFAAAPDLLAALKEAEVVLAEKIRRLGADPKVSPTYHKIRAAIAKATGSEVAA